MDGVRGVVALRDNNSVLELVLGSLLSDVLTTLRNNVVLFNVTHRD